MATKKKKNSSSSKEEKLEFQVGDLLVVHWTDISSYDGWHEVEEAKQLPLIDVNSVGWFVNTDKDSLRISSTLADSGQNVLVIPKSVIKEIQVLEYENN